MISESHTRYGSGVSPGRARHGRSRRCRSYQASSAAGSGVGASPAFVPTGEAFAFFCVARPATVMRSDVAEPAHMNKSAKTYPRPLREMLNRCLGETFAKRGFASTDIVTHWAEIVGPEIAAHAEPMRLQWPRGAAREGEPATLVLRVEGPAALEIQHLSGVIIDRVNQFFGWRAVRRIALRQAPLARRATRRAPPAPDERVVAEVAAGLPEMSDTGLRGALARLGAAVRTSSRR